MKLYFSFCLTTVIADNMTCMSISYLKSYKFCGQIFLVFNKTCMLQSLFSIKSQITDIFSFVGHMVSTATTYLGIIAPKQPLSIHKWIWLYSNKTFLPKQAADRIWSIYHSLLPLVLYNFENWEYFSKKLLSNLRKHVWFHFVFSKSSDSFLTCMKEQYLGKYILLVRHTTEPFLTELSFKKRKIYL